jgi:hypothetical protein
VSGTADTNHEFSESVVFDVVVWTAHESADVVWSEGETLLMYAT